MVTAGLFKPEAEVSPPTWPLAPVFPCIVGLSWLHKQVWCPRPPSPSRLCSFQKLEYCLVSLLLSAPGRWHDAVVRAVKLDWGDLSLHLVWSLITKCIWSSHITYTSFHFLKWPWVSVSIQGTMETNIKFMMDMQLYGPILLSSSPSHQIPCHREALILVTISPQILWQVAVNS